VKGEINLKHPTSHLKFFEELALATGLRGVQYIPVMKALWYNQLSVLIPCAILKLGSIVTDGRIQLLIFLPSGGGKGELKRTIKQILAKLGKSHIEPTSFHPEQFVGKVRMEKGKDGKPKFTPIKGHLSLDFILIDEGKELLTSSEPMFTESRKYLRIALDTYLNNTVTKKSVDIEQKHALSYLPHCCVCIFVQPFKVSEKLVLDGDLRRYIVSYTPILAIDMKEIYKARIREEIDYEAVIKSFTSFLVSIKIPASFELTDQAIDAFEELSILLIETGRKRSSKIKKFIEMADFTIQNLLLKFSAIQALQDNSGLILIGRANWGEEGRYKEAILRNMIKKFISPKYTVGTGFIVKEIRTELKCSTQIDILIFDSDYPILFSEGDFYIVTPNSVKAVVEVKTELRIQDLEDSIRKLNKIGSFLSGISANRPPFLAIFSFEGDYEPNDALEHRIKTKIKNGIDYACFIDCISLNKDIFIKYFPNINSFSVYDEELSFSFFISNLIHSTTAAFIDNESSLWFPHDKELNKLFDIELR
jgi:hypothetical protein